MKGLVMKSTGSWYDVLTDGGEVLPCRLRGQFRIHGIKSTNPVVVGDHVTVEREADGAATIVGIETRRNYIERKSTNLSKISHVIAANIDVCFLMVTLKEPRTSLGFIDRFLVSAEGFRIPVCLLFNKMDLYDDKELERYRKNHTGDFRLQRYKGLGEMDPDQLWETTLDPDRRVLKRVEIEDARLASEMTEMLMGSEVPPRRQFIYEHADEAEIDA